MNDDVSDTIRKHNSSNVDDLMPISTTERLTPDEAATTIPPWLVVRVLVRKRSQRLEILERVVDGGIWGPGHAKSQRETAHQSDGRDGHQAGHQLYSPPIERRDNRK